MKYPNIIFFRFNKYSDIDSCLLNKSYNCTFNITDNVEDLNRLFNPNYHLLITFGDTEKEYHNIILPNIVNRFANRWIHKSREGILNIEEFNSTINYCYINNVIMERKIQRPEFSVFTTCYNTWDKFDRVYNSLKNQNLKDWEWVIIDDTPLPENDKNNHFDFLREKCKNDSRIRLYCRSENSGNIGNVKNEAVSLCRGKYILELDHDDEILPDCLFDASNEFKDEKVGFVYMDFINIYENGDNFSYGDFICKGYGGYYCQKYKDKWVNVYITPNINNITLSHLVCCPNHPRIWRKSVLLRLENYSEFLPICDDYEILLKTALNTKIVKIHKLGYIQYMNDGNSNFSLIRNGEINRIGPNHIFPQFYEMYNVNDKMKQLDAYEDENFIFNCSQIWKRENYRHQYCNKIVNKDYQKQYCLIGEETLEISILSELYKDKTNSFIILSNTLEIEKLQELLDSKGYGNMRCYSLLDCSREELERYFMLLCKFCDNFEIINSSHDLNNSLKSLPSIRPLNSLLILFGESFRLGEQYTRNIGSDESYKQQIDAALTHIKFIESLKEKNINMTVSINSYTTKFDNSLNEIYKSVLLDSKYYENLIGQSKLIHNCIDKITNINDYDFILCMRIDLYLKDKFLQIFNPYCDKILFPSVCFKPHHKCGIHPRVNDMMMFIPKKYFNYIKKFELSHNSWYDLIVFNNLSYEDLDMMLNTYHDSDSSKDFNPIYYIVNRNVNNIHKTKEIFDKYNFEIINSSHDLNNKIEKFSERHDIVNNYIIKENKKSYLEIGIENGYTFINVNIEKKIGVDPDPKIESSNIIQKTSDEFFKDNNKNFDIIFIDGMHQVEYILKDFNNSVKFLNKNGIIFLDDILPINKNEQEKIPINPIYENGILKYSSPWTGDVWKFLYYLLLNFKDKIDYRVFTHQNYRGVVKICLKENFIIPESSLLIINSYNYDIDFKDYKEILCII